MIERAAGHEMITAPVPKRLTVLLHHLNRRAGQEKANWEILTRLARRGWDIDLVSFTLADWPDDLPIRWHPVSGLRLPTHVARSTWFRHAAGRQVRTPGVTVTNGTDAPADVAIVHYVSQAAQDLLAAGHELLPNPHDAVRRTYQRYVLRAAARRERRTYGRMKRLVAISDVVARDLRERAGVPDRVPIDVIRHAVAAEGAAAPRGGAAEPLILFVGNLERKGIAKALRVLALVKDLPWRFVALGDGDIPRWRGVSESLGLQDRVTLEGQTPSAPWFARADVLLLPTIYEPFGLVVTEAVGAGCVPLASRECGAMELWPGVPPWMHLSHNDGDALWGDALRRLLAAAAGRERIARAAAGAFASWTWEDATDAYERVLD